MASNEEKMTLTNEEYMRIFAAYLGSEVISEYNDDYPMCKGYLTGIHGEFGAEIQFMPDGNAEEEPQYREYDNTQLILRPLSDISDKDALEVCHIVEPDFATPEYRITRMGFADKIGLEDIHHTIYCIEYEHYIRIPSAEGWYKSDLIQIDTEEFDLINGVYSNNGAGYKDDIPNNIVHVIDYLRSKSYALPFNGIDLFTAGIAKREV